MHWGKHRYLFPGKKLFWQNIFFYGTFQIQTHVKILFDSHPIFLVDFTGESTMYCDFFYTKKNLEYILIFWNLAISLIGTFFTSRKNYPSIWQTISSDKNKGLQDLFSSLPSSFLSSLALEILSGIQKLNHFIANWYQEEHSLRPIPISKY